MSRVLRRLLTYLRTYRRRGAARMDHGLWIHWVRTGHYPAVD